MTNNLAVEQNISLGADLVYCCCNMHPEELYEELVDYFERNLVDQELISKANNIGQTIKSLTLAPCLFLNSPERR
ncbi:MAG: DUF1186 domain-containing protein [Methylococcales bacterium]|nr:MAG: DUF1186 domain-containing protein [Methylococcales bacterium]